MTLTKILADDLNAALSAFRRLSARVIIAVNNMATGASFSLVMSGDIVLVNSKAKFVMAYTWGLVTQVTELDALLDTAKKIVTELVFGDLLRFSYVSLTSDLHQGDYIWHTNI